MGAHPPPSSYENARLQRLEDNKRRLQDLGLATLSKTLSDTFKRSFVAKSPAKPRNKPIIAPELQEQRRSSRIALKPAPIYKDMDIDFPRFRRSVARGVNIRRRCISNHSDHAKEEAAYIASNIHTNHPSFVKRMLPSHVSSCFWLGLPVAYCKAHLPKSDEFMTLVDEKGNEWQSLYLARKTGLSAGWKRFAEDNELEDGDAVLFELVQYNKFNVQIIRAGDYETKGQENGEEDESDQDIETPSKSRKKMKKS